MNENYYKKDQTRRYWIHNTVYVYIFKYLDMTNVYVFGRSKNNTFKKDKREYVNRKMYISKYVLKVACIKWFLQNIFPPHNLSFTENTRVPAKESHIKSIDAFFSEKF